MVSGAETGRTAAHHDYWRPLSEWRGAADSVDLLLHPGDGRVPRGLGEHLSHLGDALRALNLGYLKRPFASMNEFLRGVAEKYDMSVGIGHVGDPGTYNRPLGSHVFETLRGADESRRVVARE